MLQVLIHLYRRLRVRFARRTLGRTVLLLCCLAVVSALLMQVLEGRSGSGFASFGDGLWWFVVTSTTVGYGDLYPKTTGGRLVGSAVMLLGIGTVGFVLANITSNLVERKLKQSMGLVRSSLKDHIIICGWTPAARDVVRELVNEKHQVVVVANLEQNPDERVEFVRGDSTDDAILKAAGVERAKACLIIEEQGPQADARAVLIILSVKAINPAIRVIAQVFDPQNSVHLRRAGADEVIQTQDLGNKLMVRAALHKGVTQVFSELITNQYGQEIYRIKNTLLSQQVPFTEALSQYKNIYNIIVIGLERDGQVELNPESDCPVLPGDDLIVLAEKVDGLPKV